MASPLRVCRLAAEDVRTALELPVYQQAIRHHQERALNPTHPHQRGTAQGPDVYMQVRGEGRQGNRWFDGDHALGG